MIKSWIIKTDAPFCGTSQYYAAYSETSPCEIQEINDWFWDEETENLWDMYSFYNDDMYHEEFEESEINDWEEFMDEKLQEWKEDCNIECFECSENEFTDYTPEGCNIEIIYDERKK